MNKKFRYSLIVAGFIIFGITVPLIILFVSGKKLNWHTKKIISTGIIAFKIEPADATIYLNNLEQNLGNAEYKYIRDLQQGQYLLTAQKPHYQTWQTTIKLEPSKVFWAKPEDKKIILFRAPSATSTLLTNLNDLWVKDNQLFAVDNTTLYWLKKNNSSSTPAKLTLPKVTNKLTASPNGNFLLLTGQPTQKKPPVLLVELNTQTLLDLTDTLPNSATHLTLNNQGEIIFLDKNKPYLLSLKSKKPLLLSTTETLTDFQYQEDKLYFINETAQSAELKSLDVKTQNLQTLYTLPSPLKSITLNSVNKKFVYFHSAQNLYQFGLETGNLVEISRTFTQALSSPTNGLIWQTNQSFFYLNQKNQLSSASLPNYSLLHPMIEEDLDYVIFTHQNQIYASELSSEPTPNQFLLYSGKNIKTCFLSEDKKTLWILDDRDLNFISLR